MPLLTAFISGLLFGAGLLISDMVNPAKVISFLDITGNWDPSLALLMGTALALFIPGYRFLIRPKSKPALAESFHLPAKKQIDKPLLTGAAIFGAGWGFAGICPGPAVVNLGGGQIKILGFFVAMLLGMASIKLWQKRSRLKPVANCDG